MTNKKSHGLIKKNLIAVSLSEAHAPGSIFFFLLLMIRGGQPFVRPFFLLNRNTYTTIILTCSLVIMV